MQYIIQMHFSNTELTACLQQNALSICKDYVKY